MNPFDRIREYRSTVLQAKESTDKLDNTLTYEQHYSVLLNFLKMLEEDLKNVEYNYAVERMGKNDTQYSANGRVTFQSFHINENLLLFQPLFSEDGAVTISDMESLIEALETLKKHEKIKEDILIIPPEVNVFKAVLADPEDKGM